MRHHCANRQAKHSVRKLKNAINPIIASIFDGLERGVDTVLLQYGNAKHSVTKEIPTKLIKGRILRSNIRRLESPCVTCYRGNDLRPVMRIVVKNVAKSMVEILDDNDLSTHNRYVEQIQFQEPSESVPIPVFNSNTNEHILDHAESTSNTQSDKHMMNLRKSAIDYRNLDSH
ncbi:unnamed protein product [Schistosoma curassoni]|uniref:Reverse transcriptase domain-containing protein n=1 Tax=Schistosoma curassoni TaxID=6186 RepID=A0A183KV60_9TREM|nr:unnamed protein product [Schistosoma curassoni]